jgi:hypothetical protein
MRSWLALALTLSVVACGSAGSDDAAPQGDQGDEQDITSTKSHLKGSWTITDDSKALTSTVAYELRPNGEFWRDDNKIFNGVMVKGAPQPVARTSGHYTIDTSKKTISFHVDAGPQKGLVEELSYVFEAGKVLNGVFLPGHEPDTRAHLTLTGIAAPGSHVAFPALKFALADSYCTADADCADERGDGTWTPGQLPPGAGLGPVVPNGNTCDTNARTCFASLPKN